MTSSSSQSRELNKLRKEGKMRYERIMSINNSSRLSWNNPRHRMMIKEMAYSYFVAISNTHEQRNMPSVLNSTIHRISDFIDYKTYKYLCDRGNETLENILKEMDAKRHKLIDHIYKKRTQIAGGYYAPVVYTPDFKFIEDEKIDARNPMYFDPRAFIVRGL